VRDPRIRGPPSPPAPACGGSCAWSGRSTAARRPPRRRRDASRKSPCPPHSRARRAPVVSSARSARSSHPHLQTHTHGRRHPHLSYAVLLAGDLDDVRRTLSELLRGGPFSLSFHGTVTFPRGRRPSCRRSVPTWCADRRRCRPRWPRPAPPSTTTTNPAGGPLLLALPAGVRTGAARGGESGCGRAARCGWRSPEPPSSTAARVRCGRSRTSPQFGRATEG